MNRPIPPGSAADGMAEALGFGAAQAPSEKARRTPAEPPARRICILVLGMHRSGTSALTRVISLLGAALPKTVLGANPTNPTGHWEPQRLIDLHDQMLAEAGSSWDDWRAFDPADLARPRLHFYRAAIAQILDEEFGDAPLFVLKEPRLARFVPLYIDIFEAMGVELRFVHICRNPLAVIASLAKRDRFTEPFTALLWLRHELEAERATRGRSRVFVSYEGLIDNWPNTLAKLDAALGLDWPRPPAESGAEIDAYLSHEHQHHAASEARLRADGRIGSWVKDGFAALRALGANADDAQAELVLERVGAEFDAAARMFGDAFYGELAQRQSATATVERHWRETAAQRAEELARLAAETGQKAEEAATLIQQKVRERDELLAQLAERDMRLGDIGAELERRAAERQQEVAGLTADLARLEQRAKDLEADDAAARAGAERERADLMRLLQDSTGELAALRQALAEQAAALQAELQRVAAERDQLRQLSNDHGHALANLAESSARQVGELEGAKAALEEKAARADAELASLAR